MKQLAQIRQIINIIEFVKKHIIVSYNTKTMWGTGLDVSRTKLCWKWTGMGNNIQKQSFRIQMKQRNNHCSAN